MNLDEFKPSPDALIRKFRYPELVKDSVSFSVRLRYLTKESMAELKEQLQVQILHQKKNDQALTIERVDEFSQHELAVYAIISCDEMTVGKYADHAPLKDEVIEKYGLDEPVPMDPTVLGKGDEAKRNIRYLLQNSNDFTQWVLRTCMNIGRFQDQEWKERLSKNFERGRGTSSEQKSSAETAVTASKPTS